MEITLEELKQRMAEQLEECELIDKLGLTTFDLVELLSERIEERYEKLVGDLELMEDEEKEDGREDDTW